MYGREKLKYKILDKGGYQGETKAYIKADADSVMDDLEAQVNNMEKANAELIKRVQTLEEDCNKLEEQNQRLFDEAYESNGKVIELESLLITLEELNNKRALRIKELEAQCTKYQAELMNNDPALNYALPTTVDSSAIEKEK